MHTFLASFGILFREDHPPLRSQFQARRNPLEWEANPTEKQTNHGCGAVAAGIYVWL